MSVDTLLDSIGRYARTKPPDMSFTLAMWDSQISPRNCDYYSIPMNQPLDKNKVIECILRNLITQNASLSSGSWIEMIGLLRRKPADMDSLSYDLALQYLFMVTKLDEKELIRCGSTLKREIESVLPLLVELQASLIEESQHEEAKEFLRNTIVLRAINQSLAVVGMGMDDETRNRFLNEMHIYGAKATLPVRGYCVTDGIFINLAEIDRFNVLEKNRADFLTLVGHEATHYFARRIFGDYTFSSPISNLKKGDQNPRTDEEYDFKNFELGRDFERKLFGRQPDWRSSRKEAASRFFELISDPETQIPLQIFGLAEQAVPTLSFGIAYKSGVRSFLKF